MYRIYIACLLVGYLWLVGCVSVSQRGLQGFTVRIENVSGTSDLATSLAPGVFVVHDQRFSLYQSGAPDSGIGLESLVEDGNPAPLANSIAGNISTTQTGVFNTPSDVSEPANLLPGGDGVYEFVFRAGMGTRLSFVFMVLESNDIFLGTEDGGIDLFPDEMPLSGTLLVHLCYGMPERR